MSRKKVFAMMIVCAMIIMSMPGLVLAAEESEETFTVTTDFQQEAVGTYSGDLVYGTSTNVAYSIVEGEDGVKYLHMSCSEGATGSPGIYLMKNNSITGQVTVEARIRTSNMVSEGGSWQHHLKFDSKTGTGSTRQLAWMNDTAFCVGCSKTEIGTKKDAAGNTGSITDGQTFYAASSGNSGIWYRVKFVINPDTDLVLVEVYDDNETFLGSAEWTSAIAYSGLVKEINVFSPYVNTTDSSSNPVIRRTDLDVSEIKVSYDEAALKHYLSLENNADRYVEGSGTFSVNVTKYNELGGKQEVTGATLTSSNPAVFAVEGDQLVPKKAGYSLITAEYDGMTASMTMVCISEDMPTETGSAIPDTFKVTDGSMTGHNGGQAYKQLYDGSGAWYSLRVLVNRNQQWFTSGYRYMSGWFYDDLSSPAGLYMDVEDSTTWHSDFVKDYSYGSFDWTGSNYYKAMVRIGAHSTSATTYTDSNNTIKQPDKTFSRSKGWHQVAAMLVQDETAQYGWRMVYYLDGQKFGQIDIVPQDSSTTTESCFELRALNYIGSYYSDLLLTGNINIEYATITVNTVGQGTVEGITASGDTVDVAVGSDKTFTFHPAEGWQVSSVVLAKGGTLPVTDNQVTITNVSQSDTMTVTFTQIPPSDPAVSSVSVQTGSSYKPEGAAENESYKTAVVYAKLTVPANYTLKECGVSLSKDGEFFANLKAERYSSDYQFGIRFYGKDNAIVGDYTTKVYAEFEDGTSVAESEGQPISIK